jgi:hypothetical protein
MKTKIKQKSIRKRRRTRKLLNCSPKDKSELNQFSCYTNTSLYKLRDLWNVRHKDAPIRTNDAKQIHRELSNHMRNVCNKESCWLKQTFANDSSNELKQSFAPDSPAEWKTKPNAWLSSTELIKVMKQYEKAYKCFDFIGPSPIDFDLQKLYGECVWEELCNFNVEQQIKLGKTKIGMIFNTDPHDQPGEHWISMFVNLKTHSISFFDSVGDTAPNEVKILVERIQSQGRNLTTPIEITYDENHPVEHQYESSECGVYSLFFIVHMLEDKITSKYLKTHILKDKYMESFRKIYFTPT